MPVQAANSPYTVLTILAHFLEGASHPYCKAVQLLREASHPHWGGCAPAEARPATQWEVVQCWREASHLLTQGGCGAAGGRPPTNSEDAVHLPKQGLPHTGRLCSAGGRPPVHSLWGGCAVAGGRPPFTQGGCAVARGRPPIHSHWKGCAPAGGRPPIHTERLWFLALCSLIERLMLPRNSRKQCFC